MRKYKKFFIPAIGLFGLMFALYMVFFGVKKTPVPEIEFFLYAVFHTLPDRKRGESFPGGLLIVHIPLVDPVV